MFSSFLCGKQMLMAHETLSLTPLTVGTEILSTHIHLSIQSTQEAKESLYHQYRCIRFKDLFTPVLGCVKNPHPNLPQAKWHFWRKIWGEEMKPVCHLSTGCRASGDSTVRGRGEGFSDELSVRVCAIPEHIQRHLRGTQQLVNRDRAEPQLLQAVLLFPP